MRSIDYSALRGLKAGALGGLVGAAVLGLLAGLSAFVLDQEVFYVTIGLAQEVRPRHDPKELLGRTARRNHNLDRRLCAGC